MDSDSHAVFELCILPVNTISFDNDTLKLASHKPKTSRIFMSLYSTQYEVGEERFCFVTAARVELDIIPLSVAFPFLIRL